MGSFQHIVGIHFNKQTHSECALSGLFLLTYLVKILIYPPSSPLSPAS